MAQAAGLEQFTWVLSAGYGLIPTSAPIHPYSATFSSGNPDSVTHQAGKTTSVETSLQEWWAQLARFQGPVRDAPRSIGDLARRDPAAAILIVASPRYVRAIEPDAIRAAHSLDESNHLLIISGQLEGRSSPLREHLIQSDASLRTLLGGVLFSLHARVARWVLAGVTPTTLTVEAARSRLNRLREKAVECARPNRQRMTDAQVHSFIERTVRKVARPTPSSLLRILRDSGRACEQSRFRTLFAQVVRTHAS